jgi:hypothetical protein
MVGVACGDNTEQRTLYFEPGVTSTAETFWNFPFPSDLRTDAAGAPDMTGFPNPRSVPILTSLLSAVPETTGWPVMPTVYFRFTAEPPHYNPAIVYARGPARLIDIDSSSDERGRQFPVVIANIARDAYSPDFLIAVAPRPGIVLRARTRYAVVLLDDFAPGFSAPSKLFDTFPELPAVLEELELPRESILGATIFTTGDESARSRARSEAIRAQHDAVLTAPQPVGGDSYNGFCRIDAVLAVPQFQTGDPPFDADGRFMLDGNDVPIAQTMVTLPVVITLPKAPMPATGWPLYQFFHGSGGSASDVVDLGPSLTAGGAPVAGQGPAFVVARHGLAAVAGALPLSPQRLPGASESAYLNINNLAAFPSTFQQGVFEQRLLLDALLALRIPDASLAGCTGITSVGGEHFFDGSRVTAGGQSLGATYMNLTAAVEHRFGAVVPTGSGGFWNLSILERSSSAGVRALLGTALGVDDEVLSFMHPTMNVLALAWQPAEPMAAMARLSRRPLEGIARRHIYEPVSEGDTRHPTLIYDAAALSFGNELAGTQVWSSMRSALALDDLDAGLMYPVTANRDGVTGVVVQFEGDGLVDPHFIFRQLDGVKHQYACFLATYVRDGVPIVAPPNVLAHPCP